MKEAEDKLYDEYFVLTMANASEERFAEYMANSEKYCKCEGTCTCDDSNW